jgi:hypothetical protein
MRTSPSDFLAVTSSVNIIYRAWKNLASVRTRKHCLYSRDIRIHDKPNYNPNVPPFMARVILEGCLDVVCSLDILASCNGTNRRAYAIIVADTFISRNSIAWNKRCAKVLTTRKLVPVSFQADTIKHKGNKLR